MSDRNQVLAEKAKKLIPGGAHTYSKGDDQFPANAPKIISHGKGAYIWDVDGSKYLDMAMSLGTVLLGHAYEPVVEAVKKELTKGVNFCRPSHVEAELAEMLVEIIPSAEMVKFAKNGSDAVTAATRLARAYTGRDYIVRCANDPFNAVHDWFIGSTIMSRGIPKTIRDLTLQFNYNDLEGCKRLFEEYPGKIACVLLEPVSMMEPQKGFLEGLKTLCEENGAILIFDEVVSGFRFSLGGAQEMVGVTPHLSAFGKGMANGFSVSALVGQRDLMNMGGIDHDQERVFLLSTTHGGETHSLAAAKATIAEIKEKNLIEHFWRMGKNLQDRVLLAAERTNSLDYVEVSGYSCKPGFVFKNEKGELTPEIRTLFLQETIKEGLLMPYVVPCYSHGEEEIEFAGQAIEKALEKIKSACESGDVRSWVEGPIVKPVFRKFN